MSDDNKINWNADWDIDQDEGKDFSKDFEHMPYHEAHAEFLKIMQRAENKLVDKSMQNKKYYDETDSEYDETGQLIWRGPHRRVYLTGESKDRLQGGKSTNNHQIIYRHWRSIMKKLKEMYTRLKETEFFEIKVKNTWFNWLVALWVFSLFGYALVKLL